MQSRSDDVHAVLLRPTFLSVTDGLPQTHFKTLVLNHMPGDFSRMPDHKRLNPRFPEPNLDATVFIAVDREVRGLLLRDRTGQGRDEELDMAVGSQHVLKYDFAGYLQHLAKLRP